METLSKHFREITKAAFARHGFGQGEVVGNWAEIVGEDLAAVSAPERIRWPRAAAAGGARTGGTLVIRAAAGRAIDLQYAGPRIIGRINSFFGHAAIAQIKVVQAATELAADRRKPPPDQDIPYENQSVEQMTESPLKDALRRLGKGITRARQSSPQGK